MLQQLHSLRPAGRMSGFSIASGSIPFEGETNGDDVFGGVDQEASTALGSNTGGPLPPQGVATGPSVSGSLDGPAVGHGSQGAQRDTVTAAAAAAPTAPVAAAANGKLATAGSSGSKKSTLEAGKRKVGRALLKNAHSRRALEEKVSHRTGGPA